MSQIIQRLDQQQLKSLCGVVAHTSEGLTKSELTTLLCRYIVRHCHGSFVQVIVEPSTQVFRVRSVPVVRLP